MLKIYGDNPHLWQWNTGRKLVVNDDACSVVWFCNGTTEKALPVAVKTEDGHRVAEIPNILLQSARSITAYLARVANGERETRCSRVFQVWEAPQPDDYVYTETEVMSYQALEKRVTALEEGGTGGGGLIIDSDGAGNVTITVAGSASITSDGAGNVTIV